MEQDNERRSLRNLRHAVNDVFWQLALTNVLLMAVLITLWTHTFK